MILKSISLQCTTGGSSKQYDLSLVEVEGGVEVHYAFGKIGATLTPGKRTSEPVPFEEGKKIYDKILRGQLAKAYVPVGGVSEGQVLPEGEELNLGSACQLLEPIELADIDKYIQDDQFWMQEKKDGVRKMLQKKGFTITSTNRKAKYCGYNRAYGDALFHVAGDVEIDGESVGDVFYAFDILSKDGESLMGKPYEERLLVLEELAGQLPADGAIEVVYTARTKEEKRALFDKSMDMGLEGVVIKDRRASYVAGRTKSGNANLKAKFWNSCTALVSAVNKQRSVALVLLDGEEKVSVGNVTIPVNYEVPTEGMCVEIRYLYAYKGGSVYQPIYLGEREDIDPNECLLSQLRYKAIEKETRSAAAKI